MPYDPSSDTGYTNTLVHTIARAPLDTKPFVIPTPSTTLKQSRNDALTLRFRLYTTAKRLATSPESAHHEREIGEQFRTNWKITVAEPSPGRKHYACVIAPRDSDPVTVHTRNALALIQAQLGQTPDLNQPSDPATDQFVLNALGVNPDNGLGKYSTNQPEPDETAPSPDDIPANPYTQARKNAQNKPPSDDQS